jgi:hypothetical protein
MTVVKLLVLAARYGIADLLRCECHGIAFRYAQRLLSQRGPWKLESDT